MVKRKTPQEYYEECKEKGLDLPIEDYVNKKTKIKHKCKQGHIYKQRPTNHLRNHGCPYCVKKHKYTPKEYCDICRLKKLDLPIEDYKHKNTKILFKCREHGIVYQQTPHSHYISLGCPLCISNIRSSVQKKTSYDYLEECKKGGYDLPIEKYKGYSTKIKHKCKLGHIYMQTPHDHLSGCGCSICNGTPKKTTNQYYNECKEHGLDLPIDSYVNTNTKIRHRCNKCNFIYYQTPNNHLYGYGCPICRESRGEKFIRNYLDTKHIKYETQKTFKDLKDKSYLSYDFYLSTQNILIEYQGIQHYKVSDYFGGKEQFKIQQLHDKMKKDYAKKHHYRLLELHYSLDTQEKVNKYLERRLKD